MRKPTLKSWATLGLLGLHSLLAAAEITAEALPHLPELWPSHVHLREETQVRANDRETSIQPLIPGVLVRVTPEGALIDFGSSGRHTFPLGETDILEQANDIQSHPGSKKNGLLYTQIADKFWRWNGQKLQHLGPDYFNDKQYLVFVYAEPNDVKSRELVATLARAYGEIEKQAPEAEIVLLSGQKEVQPFFDQDAPTFPLMAWHMAKGYIYALAHPIDTRPAIVITDFNNRIVYPREGTSTLPETHNWADWIHQIIEEDQAALAADPLRQEYLGK